MATKKPTTSNKAKKTQRKAEMQRVVAQRDKAAPKQQSGARFEEYVRAAMTGLCAYGAHDTAPRGAALRAVQIARDTMAAVDESPSERDVAARGVTGRPGVNASPASGLPPRRVGVNALSGSDAWRAEEQDVIQPVVEGQYAEVPSQKRRTVTARQRSR